MRKHSELLLLLITVLILGISSLSFQKNGLLKHLSPMNKGYRMGRLESSDQNFKSTGQYLLFTDY